MVAHHIASIRQLVFGLAPHKHHNYPILYSSCMIVTYLLSFHSDDAVPTSFRFARAARLFSTLQSDVSSEALWKHSL